MLSDERLVKVWYWAITTLSTVGYGDLYPLTYQERSMGCLVVVIGVCIFGFIMGEFIEILMNYKGLWKEGNHKDLSKWINLLQRFNNSIPLNKTLIADIEEFMTYYWENNRLSSVNDPEEERMLAELPCDVQS